MVAHPLRIRALWFMTLAFAMVTIPAPASQAAVCPFCSAINLTFAEQMKSNDIVVIARLVTIPDPVDDPNAELPKATFEIAQILKGERFVEPGMKFNTLLVGRYPLGHEFLVMGVDPPNVAWSTPMKTSPRVTEYLTKIQELPPTGPDRLAFFQQYFEDPESVLAFDAYDEFAVAPYDDLIALKPRMEHDKLVQWVRDPQTSVNRRRLYLAMLGICGDEDDATMMEEFIRSGDRKKQAGLDALIASYLRLKGDAGLPLIEQMFLSNKDAEYVDTLSAVSALRFHGTDSDTIPRERIVKSIRLLLDRPKMADMIIPDLARWEDWSVMERLVELFKQAQDNDSSWLRVPVITYLRACPRPEAKTYIEELRKIDPDAVARADFFLNFEEGGDDWDDDDPAADPDADAPSPGESDSEPVEQDTREKPIEGGGTAGADPASPAGKDPGENDHVPVEFQPVRVQKPPLPEDATFTVAPADGVDPNPSDAIDVSTMGPTGSMSATSVPSTARGTSRPIPPTPVAASSPRISPSWQIILIPMAFSVAIFVLMWSVLNGWFERLIY